MKHEESEPTAYMPVIVMLKTHTLPKEGARAIQIELISWAIRTRPGC